MAYSDEAQRLMCKSRDDMRALTADIDARFGEKITTATMSAKVTAAKVTLTALETELAAP